MKPKTMILMIVAVACGLVAAILVSKLAARGPSDDNVEMVLVAIAPMKEGEKLGDKGDIEKKFDKMKFYRGTAPPGSFTTENLDARIDKIQNKTLVKPLAAGEAITEKHLTDENITQALGPGERAMSIPVRIDNIASGFALPGNRVDLITKYQADTKTVSKIFLQDVKILAVGTDTKKPEGAPAMPNATVVTLAVKPKDAAKINWALSTGGTITMALRAPGDDKAVKPNETAVASLGGNDSGVDDEKTETVLVALREIEKGTDLKGKDLKEYFKEQRVPEGLFGNDVFVKNMADDALKEAKIKETIKANTPVMRVLLGEAANTPSPVEVRAPEEHQLTIYNGSREPNMTKFQRASGVWSSRSTGADNSSPPVTTPPPTKDPTDKEAPKTGSEGK
jgi:pilus assembly protein CpaB